MAKGRSRVLAFSALAALAAAGRPAAAEEEEIFEPPELSEDGEAEGGEEAYPPPEAPGADEEESPAPTERARPVRVSAFLFTTQEVDDRVATEIVAGLRRGLRADTRLAWVDPTAALESQDTTGEDAGEEAPSPVESARESLARAFEVAAEGSSWREVTSLLDDVLETLEANLAEVQRSDLVDASMLWAAAQCMQRRRRTCETAFRRVVTFRETVEWDPRLPPEAEEVFESAREETLAGPRGSVRIEAFPTGAEVFVDGRFVGAAPCRAEGLLAGDHYVTLTRLGYHRLVQRVAVETDFEDTVGLELVQLGNEPLLRQALQAAREEMGEQDVGAGMRDLWSLLLADQLVLGDLRRVGETETFDVTLYLYDLRTRHLLNTIEARLGWEVMSLGEAEALAARLYEGVDVSGRIRPVEQPIPVRPREPDPFYRTWWFWSIFGAAIVGTAIGVASAFLPYMGGGQPVLELGF